MNANMNINQLPDELCNMIFLYLENPEARLIKNEFAIYQTDHNYYYTKRSGHYYVKNIMSFSDYYFDKIQDPFEYISFQECPENIYRHKQHIAYINSYFEGMPR